MKLLIAEDDPVTARILRTHTEAWGHEAEVVRDGLEAWERLGRWPTRYLTGYFLVLRARRA